MRENPVFSKVLRKSGKGETVKKSEKIVKDDEAIVEAKFDTTTEAIVKGDRVSLIGFGNFEVRERAARTGKNPQTGAEIKIPACKAPAFKPDKALKDAVNK